jgi:inosine/xanthosine triphosphatase
MRVSVGSGNPVKIAAVENALADVVGVTIEGVEVDSGVAEQPASRAETITGAETRAENALTAGAYDLGVGIEGGVTDVEGLPGLYLTMWAAVTDGERTTHGGGPTLRLPGSMADQVREGRELGPVIDEVIESESADGRAASPEQSVADPRTSHESVGEGPGAAGVLTGYAVDRESSLTHAVAAALGPFVTSRYDL